MVDISYITSVYNSAEFLDGLISNLLDQSNENFEHILVDSASTDDSVAIIQKWMAKDQRVKLIQQKERTPYGVSWLQGWFNAKGLIISNSNSDDRSYFWRGTQIMNAWRDRHKTYNTPCAFYYGGYETRVNGVVTAKGIPPFFSVEDMSQFFRCGVHIHWESRLLSYAKMDTMLRAAEEYKSAFDYWLVLYFMSLGAVGVPIPSCFSIYNQRSNSLEMSNKELNTFESLRAIETFYPQGKSIIDLETKTRLASPEFYRRYREFVNKFAVEDHN